MWEKISLKFHTRWSLFRVSWEAIFLSAPYDHVMTENYLQDRIIHKADKVEVSGFRTADREICKQLRSAISA